MNATDKENLHKEIDLIQACITRMANNSFKLKGWAISIAAIVFALIDKNINPVVICLVILLPLLGFWYLDAFFLFTEKKYRELYNWVITERQKSNPEMMYDLNPNRFSDIKDKNGKNITHFSVMMSLTLRYFYGIPIIITIIISVFLFTSKSLNTPQNPNTAHATQCVPILAPMVTPQHATVDSLIPKDTVTHNDSIKR
jgi:hypothetical protein